MRKTMELTNLNPVQKRAVEHLEGPLLILAGAGSGKTRVLTYHLAYLIEEHQIYPWNILAVTFTNKAAGEMKTRVGKLIGASNLSKLWIGTFHSMCLRILYRECTRIGYENNFTIYDSDDQVRLMKSVLSVLKLTGKEHSPRGYLYKISNLKNQLITPDENKKTMQSNDPDERNLSRIYYEYQNQLKISQAFDFDDLIMQTVLLLRNDPEVLEKYSNRFQFILVDEYQDTNHAQYTLIKLLASKYHNLCVVGDEDQSIYGFRGSDINNILDFQKDYPDATIIRLEQNYRSTGNILDAANNVVKNNKRRLGKKLWTASEKGDFVLLLDNWNDRGEAFNIAQLIKHYTQKMKYRYSDIALLYRTNAQSRSLEQGLMKYNIPYIIVRGRSFYDRLEIRDILAYLKVFVNPNDTVSLKRILNVPRRALGKTTLDKLINYASENNISLYAALLDCKNIPKLRANTKNKLDSFGQLLEKYKQKAKEIDAGELTEKLIKAIDYLRYLENTQKKDYEDRQNNVWELIAGIKEFIEDSEDESLAAYLTNIALVSDIDIWDDDTNVISLMTLHNAKGLEFPIIFICGVEWGLLPHFSSSEDENQIEEERRLFYVGMTRAEKILFLSYCRTRYKYGNVIDSYPSAFLDEIPKSLLQPVKISVQ